MSNLILPQVKKTLSSKFIKWEPVAEILSLGLTMKKPVILYGRGGHGKSEMVRAVFESLAQSASDWGIQSFGEGMSEAKLYGGLNLKSLNCQENPKIEFNPENSFLAKKYYLFEELFDAPPVVLLALKDTLMSRQLNNSHQTYPMNTELLVGATNKQPFEIAELGDSFQALTERFPLQLCVEWDSYTAEDYLELFNLVLNQDSFDFDNQVKAILAQMIADSVDKGNWISPRQAVVALNCVKTVATINNRNYVKEEDLVGLKFLPGTEDMMKELNQNLERFKKISEAETKLSDLEKQLSEFENKIEFYDKPIALLKVEKQLKHLSSSETKANFSVPDALVNRKNDARKKLTQLIESAHGKALYKTNLVD